MIGSVVPGSENINNRGLTDYSISLSVFFLNTTYQGEYKLVAEVPLDGLVVETVGNVLHESELLSFMTIATNTNEIDDSENVILHMLHVASVVICVTFRVDKQCHCEIG